MKRYIPLVTTFICAFATTGLAQQVADPETNAPVDIIPQSHSFTFPFGSYPGGVTPTYTREWDMEVPVTAGIDQQLNTSNARVKTTYFDGLHREIQSIHKKASDNDEDVIQMKTFDNLGRERYDVLPYIRAANNSTGLFDNTPVANLTQTYNSNTGSSPREPFGRTDFDNSPLNRLSKKLSSGIAWIGSERGSNTYYTTNGPWTTFQNGVTLTITGGYPHWIIGPNASDLPQWVGDYDANQLVAIRTVDEDGHSSETFKDKFGKLVFSRSKLNAAGRYPTDYAYTSYVYDDLGNLRCVIPPKAVVPVGAGIWGGYHYVWSLSQQAMDNLCFQYVYDSKGRQTERKVPGKSKEYTIYDKWNRPVLTQDGNQRNNNQWVFNIFNARDKILLSGLYNYAGSRSSLQLTLDGSLTESAPSLYYYLKTASLLEEYPNSISNCKILTMTYYSKYDYPGLSGFSFEPNIYPETPAQAFKRPFVMSTLTDERISGTKLRILDPENPNGDSWITTVNYYDNKGNLIQQQVKNHRGGTDIISYQYTFRGDQCGKIIRHNNPYAKIMPAAIPFVPANSMEFVTVKTTYNLNMGTNGHVWSIRQAINNDPDFTLASYEYNPFGKVAIKNLPGANVLYDYNLHNNIAAIRAFLNISSAQEPCFTESVHYEDGFASKLYNGNIAGVTWQGYGLFAPQRFYGYSYDNLNRLTHAEFGERTSSIAYSKAVTDYSVSDITYDLNGNLMTMKQMGVGGGASSPLVMDELMYNYLPNSNQLVKVDDAGDNSTMLPDFKDEANLATEYNYDASGNITLDANKGLASITYNYLNKPEKIVVTGKGTITFVYDALGNKLQKKVQDDVQASTTTYDYIGTFCYKNSMLQYFTTDEGRCRPYLHYGQSTFGYTEPTRINYAFDYFIKDHAGNVRQTMSTETRTREYIARHEIATANVEQLVFDNIELVRDIKPGSTDPGDVMAAHLDASDPSKRIGTAVMLRVMPGDQFEIGADGYYDGTEPSEGSVPVEEMLSSLLTSLTKGITYSGVPVAELPDNIRQVNEALNNPGLSAMLENLSVTNENPDAPQANLNYLVFDDKVGLVPALSGKVQMSGTVNEWGRVAPSGIINISQPGYIIIYVDNRTINRAVWWDRISINHTSGRIIGEDHYYPFGLTLSEESGIAGEENYRKYRSMELNRDEFIAGNGHKSGLEWYDFGARMLDPQLGRWTGIDMKAPKYANISPYAFAGNNPTMFSDPNGEELVLTGAVADVTAATQRIQNMVGSSYTVSINSDNVVTMTPVSGFDGEVSAQQQTAIDVLIPITSPETPRTTIGIVSNSSKVDVGSYERQEIDIADVDKYDHIDNLTSSPTVYSGNGKMVHEMNEQYRKQVLKENELDAHNPSITVENKYNGSERPKSERRSDGELVIPNSAPPFPTGPNSYTRESHVTGKDGKVVKIQENYINAKFNQETETMEDADLDSVFQMQ